MTATQDLAYQTPAKKRTLNILFYLIGVAVCLLLYVVFSGLLLYQAPRHIELYKDFRYTLPAVTETIVVLSFYYREWYLWLVAIPLIGLVPLPLLFLRFSAHWLWAFAVLFLLAILLAAATEIALLLPVIKLMESVSGGVP